MITTLKNLSAKRLAVIGVLLVTLFTGYFAYQAQVAETMAPPSTPWLPWERPDGSIDYSKLPTSLPKLNCAGTVVGTMLDPYSGTTSHTPTNADGTSCIDVTTEHAHSDDE